MEILNIKDGQGREMRITARMLEIAKDYGWTSGIADEDMAQALDKAKGHSYSDESKWNFTQSIGTCIESSVVIEFCRGGSNINPMI